MTLSDYQNLLGDINWIRPYVKFITAELKPSFNVLQGHSDPPSEKSPVREARKALDKVKAAVSIVM